MTLTDPADDTAPGDIVTGAMSTPATMTRLAPLGLVAVLTWLAIDMVKASGPMEDFGFSVSIAMAAVISIGTYLLPAVWVGVFLAGAFLRHGRERVALAPASALWWSVIALVIARGVLQFTSVGDAYLLGLATVGLALGSLLLAVLVLTARLGGAFDTALAVTIGSLLAVGASTVFGSWDPIWQSGIVPLLVVLTQVTLALGLAWPTRNEPIQHPPSRRSWVLGPFLAVGTMTFLNPAFLASQGGLGFGWASRILSIGLTLAVVLLFLVGNRSRPGVTLVSGITMIAAIPVAYLATGPIVAVALVAAALSSSVVLSKALDTKSLRKGASPTNTHPDSVARPLSWSVRRLPFLAWTLGLAAIAGLFIVLTQLLFQLDYDLPLPFPNWFLPTLAIIALALAAWLSRPGPGDQTGVTARTSADAPSASIRWGRAIAGAVTATALVTTLVTAPDITNSASATAPAEITVLDWNLHYSVSTDPGIELESIATTIEESGAGVALLQEVNRGWVFGASTDTAEWLARRLDMTYAWAPAADCQFGNLILSRYALTDIEIQELPFGQGPQRRSAISATILLDGAPLRLTSVHLQHRNENTPTRVEQINSLLASQAPQGPAVIGGDMNAYPDWDKINLFSEASFRSAQDEIGDPTAFTSPTNPATNRIDYIFGRSIEFTSFEIGTSQASDHFPLVTRLQIQ